MIYKLLLLATTFLFAGLLFLWYISDLSLRRSANFVVYIRPFSSQVCYFCGIYQTFLFAGLLFLWYISDLSLRRSAIFVVCIRPFSSQVCYFCGIYQTYNLSKERTCNYVISAGITSCS
jgi:hypothetical protein